MAQKRASVTEAKNRLSALLDRVRHGDSVIIEDRGIPVARLESVIGTAGDARLERLEREGIARRPTAPSPTKLLSTPPPRLGAPPSEIVIAERRDGR